MKHFASPEFWTCYDKLPKAVRESADKALALLKQNPWHPSLRFKQLQGRQDLWPESVTL